MQNSAELGSRHALAGFAAHRSIVPTGSPVGSLAASRTRQREVKDRLYLWERRGNLGALCYYFDHNR